MSKRRSIQTLVWTKILRKVKNVPPLPAGEVACLAQQIFDSLLRVRYLECSSAYVASVRPPATPLEEAVFSKDSGDIESALWQVFLAVHFGKSQKTGWNGYYEIFKPSSQSCALTWAQLGTPSGMELLKERSLKLEQDPAKVQFGNHRKYQSHSESYRTFDEFLTWLGNWSKSGKLYSSSGQSTQVSFSDLYFSLKESVFGFGRLGAYDFVTQVSHLKIIDGLKVDSLFLAGSTGPREGAKRFFGPGLSSKALEQRCLELAIVLSINPHVLEDALCNWQKSPKAYRRFNL